MSYSVAICTYNGEKYLAEQLESIINQSMKPAQIIVCDDGSEDNTNEIVTSFINSNPTIKWKHKINLDRLGVLKNFEQAIYLCDEEIVFLSDQDDVWLFDKAKKTLNALKNKKFKVVFTDAVIVDKDLNELGLTMFEKIKFSKKEQKLFHEKYWSMYLLLSKYHATGATMAFKKSTVMNFMPIPLNTCYFHDAWIATLAACLGELTFINEPLILYRQHDNQQVGAKLNTVTGLQKVYKNDIFESLIAKWENEKLIYNFIKQLSGPNSYDVSKVLKKRDYMYRALIKSKGSLIEKLLILFSFKPYSLKLQEFMSLKLFFVNSIEYLFSKNSLDSSVNEIDI